MKPYKTHPWLGGSPAKDDRYPKAINIINEESRISYVDLTLPKNDDLKFAYYNQNKELIQHIRTMEREQHKEERTKFNEYVDKIQRYFPYMEKLLPLIDFCQNTLKFSERVIQELCMLKKVRLKGDFYSPEFNRKFRDENAAFSFEEDKNKKGHFHICVNDIPLVLWFRQKANEWRNGLEIKNTKQDKGLKI